MKMDTFMKRYMKIQTDLAKAEQEKDKELKQEFIRQTVDDMIAMSRERGVTNYQAALLYIQITWWGEFTFEDVRKYGELVFSVCQDMHDAEPEASRGSVFKEVLEHLQTEAREAIAYINEQWSRASRRPRAAKWNPYWVWFLDRPRVMPPKRGMVHISRDLKTKRLECTSTGDDEDGMQDEDDEENCNGMEIDEEYDEEGEDDDAAAKEQLENDDYESCNDAEIVEGKTHVAAALNSSQLGTDDSSTLSDDHKMTLISNDGDVVAEISDLESSVYLKAFIEYWNEDPSAWRKHIDMWEETHGIPGRSILHCLKREDGDELQEMHEMPFRMSAWKSIPTVPKGHGE